MTNPRRGFGSDNQSGIHPRMLEALQAANQGHTPGYGEDPWTARAEELFRQHVHPEAKVFFVWNGTGANVVALRSLVRPYESVIATDCSHLHLDECGAPEFHTGAKLLATPHRDGKIDLGQVEPLLTRRGDQHFSQPRVISIAQPTELGTVYSVDEMAAVRAFCQKHRLLLHVDGARYAQAAHFLGLSLRELTEALSPDALSLGGTKNGMLGAEALVVFHEDRSRELRYLRKQSLQLASKSRFHAAQFCAYLEDGLWAQIAAHSHTMALRLREGLSSLSAVRILHPTQSNAVFAQIPKVWTKPLRETAYFYVWDEREWVIRLMTTFDTQSEEIHALCNKAKQLDQGEAL